MTENYVNVRNGLSVAILAGSIVIRLKSSGNNTYRIVLFLKQQLCNSKLTQQQLSWRLIQFICTMLQIYMLR